MTWRLPIACYSASGDGKYYPRYPFGGARLSGKARAVSGGSSNLTTGSTPSGTAVFPQLAVTAQIGGQQFTSANNALLAQYGMVIIGGNFPAWTSLGMTRSQLVSQLKGQPHTGRNALTPLVLQYENINEMWPQGNANNWFNEWTNAVYSNNWLVYNSGSSGTLTESIYNPSLVLANPAHVVGTDPSTGLYPWALAAQLIYNRYYLGTGSGGAAMASTELNGYFIDNMSQRNLAGSAADWERNGSNPSQTDPTATLLCTTGKLDVIAKLATINPDLITFINSEAAYDLSSDAGLGMSNSQTALYGKATGGMQQYLWSGTGSTQFGLLATGANIAGGSFSAAMNWYLTLENFLAPGTNYPVFTGPVATTDYQLVRYVITFMMLRNGWMQCAISKPASSNNDGVNPTDSSTFPVFDEFWGGSLNTAGYLGAASSTSLGAKQNSSWLQGIWRRDFVNGIALCNPSSNGSQTVALGGTFYHLSGSQVPSINNGAAVTVVTIPAGDGLILLRNNPL